LLAVLKAFFDLLKVSQFKLFPNQCRRHSHHMQSLGGLTKVTADYII